MNNEIENLIQDYAKAKRQYNSLFSENLDIYSATKAKAMVEAEDIGELCTRLEWRLKFLLKGGGTDANTQ